MLTAVRGVLRSALSAPRWRSCENTFNLSLDFIVSLSAPDLSGFSLSAMSLQRVKVRVEATALLGYSNPAIQVSVLSILKLSKG